MRKLSVVSLFFILALTAWTQQAQAPVEITAEPHHHLVVENKFVRAFAFSVDPGQSTLMHRHGHDYISIFVGDTQTMNAKEGAQPAPATFKDGDVKFAACGWCTPLQIPAPLRPATRPSSCCSLPPTKSLHGVMLRSSNLCRRRQSHVRYCG